MLRVLSVTLLALGVAGGLSGVAEAQAGPPVTVGRIEGVINPITARYVERVIRGAEGTGAAAVVLTMDTPGGLIDSTYKIDALFLNARVPVVVFVAPSGARATSAGTFIAMASHVAAMAPATNIGAAHPVAAGGANIESDLRQKAENDAVAEITKLARARGRNVEWAEKAVRESVSVRDDEALRLGVVDVLAPDVPALLERIHGREVVLPHATVRLATRGAPIREDPRNPLEVFLHLITDPQIAVLLFTLGTYGLIFELSNPSLIFPGVVGVIAIVLALFAFGTLDANAAGIALMVFAVLLFVAEIWIASHGILTAGGIAALLLGTIILFPAVTPTFPGVRYTVEPWVIALTVGSNAIFFGLLVRMLVRTKRVPLVTDLSHLVGALGVARSELAPGGIVRAEGEEWTAASATGTIAAGTPVRVLRVDGLALIVEPALEGES
ncbi:MAG TPA: nodulation protein NfeD [Candidatus Limnocylindria bacterium]|nr:nodulation protein NfeD [Candidatus Limnocylindria bacterium]